jgi:alkylation response protein AidB-like acyl-CoA dehydrogenase
MLGTEEGQGFAQLMTELPQERLLIANQAISMIERALAITIDYVKERKAFGKAVIEFQNTQFKLAELKSEATMARVFVNHCVGEHLKGQLSSTTASMAKYLTTDLQCKVARRVRPAAWRLWLHERISGGPDVPRRAGATDLWRHQRDHETADRKEPVSQ